MRFGPLANESEDYRRVRDELFNAETALRDQRERVAELRRAFIATLRDPALLADVERTKLDLEPLAGEELQAAIAGAGNYSAELIERARKIPETKN